MTRDLMVRLVGEHCTGALVLASHYDSVPVAPGSSA